MMMVYSHSAIDSVVPSPGSPPGMTTSKSSKSSSFHSIGSDDNSVLSDVNHFEDIGLNDDATVSHYDRDTSTKPQPNRFSQFFSADLRAATIQQKVPRVPQSRELARTRPHSRDILSSGRLPFPPLQTQNRIANARNTSTNALTPDSLPPKSRLVPKRSASSLSFRHRSPSPNLVNVPHGLKNPAAIVKPRRGSWQSAVERKTTLQLELECDEDVGDDIPDGLILDNVPISPRPPSERSRSASPSSSKPGSPDRSVKEKTRSIGNGTPPVAVAHGSLRSPSWKSDLSASFSETSSPMKMRDRSWTAALTDLSLETKALTEKLEEHADEMDLKAQQRSSTGSLPNVRRVVTEPINSKHRHKSALPELPPLRRNDIMIDPLPVSREKEAVLSRTRPSWLPPKNPAEEKRHLKEYQKMMAHSLDAERRREADKKLRSECRDTAASTIMQTWEHDILPRWNEAIRQRRTRDLWWRGITPRSRGAVWARAIGNELGLTEASFQAALGRALEVEARVAAGTGSPSDAQHMASFKAIRNDVQERTWQDLKIFQAGAPLHQGLMDVLMAYAMYRSDIGYVSGCNNAAAMLLLNFPNPAAAFVALANIFNRPLPLSFYSSDPGAKASAYNLILQHLSLKTPALHYHITNMPNHDPDYYLCGVLTSLFTSHLALDQAMRLWDVYVFEGDTVLIQAGVAYLTEHEVPVFRAKDLEGVRQSLDYDDNISERKQRVVTQLGEEDHWMKVVKEAGEVSPV